MTQFGMAKVLKTPVAWFATKGTGTNEAERIKMLLSGFPNVTELPFKKCQKIKSFKAVLCAIRGLKPALLVMEGTGIAGGLACILGRVIWKIPYVVSSGDAVGPFIAAHVPVAGLFGFIYELLLYLFSSGYVGWTPYLCGRALSMGAKRAITAPGWPLGGTEEFDVVGTRAKIRKEFGIPESYIVVGLVGALTWNQHRRYCYGMELVRCAHRLRRKDVAFLIVGDGSGIQRLRQEAGELLGVRIFLPGAVSLREVVPVLSAMDLGSLPQSMDGVGLFRYTTKISEYAEAGLPVITSRIPMAYDLGEEWMWRLPGKGPWEDVYIGALTTLIETLDFEQINVRKHAVPKGLDAFQREGQVRRMTAFVRELLDDLD